MTHIYTQCMAAWLHGCMARLVSLSTSTWIIDARTTDNPHPPSVLRLDYDDLTAAKGAEDPEETMCSVFRFLGADPPSRPLLHSLGVDTVKQTREPLADHIVNYDEVRYAFSCTKIAGVL